jgi:hypothetical protein
VAGDPLYRVVRRPGKQFHQERFENGKWIKGLSDKPRVLYNLSEILEAAGRGGTIWLTEGEKDADALIAQGIPATTNPGGAGKWRDEYVDPLRGARRVIVVWDNDEMDPKTERYPGQEHALQIEQSLNAAGISTRFVRALEGNDLSDHLAAGHSLDKLVRERPGDPLPDPDYQPPRELQKVEPAVYQLAVVRLHEHARERGLARPKKTDKGWEACCPAHDDRNASLGIMVGDDQPLVVSCQAGCDVFEIAKALQIDIREFSEHKPQYDAALEREIQRQKVTAEARIIIANEAVPEVDPPEIAPGEYLELEDPEFPFMIDSLHIGGANTLVVAQYKTGKTTLTLNLFRALCNSDRFLSKYNVTSPDGKIAYLDYEMLEAQFRMWLKSGGALNTRRMVTPWHLRGKSLPFWQDAVRKQLVSWLTANDVSVLIMDTAARSWAGLVDNENSNSEILRYTDALDHLKEEAGIIDLFLVTHMGRQSVFMQEGEERSRGATRLEDWMDTGWYLTRDRNGKRYMRANGRGVDVEAVALDYHPRTRHLTTSGVKKIEYEHRNSNEFIVDSVSQAKEPMTTSQLKELIPGNNKDRGVAIIRAEREGLIERRHPEGSPSRTKLIYLAPAGQALKEHRHKVPDEVKKIKPRRLSKRKAA